ncbi:MAG: hypothetical protein ACRD3O_04235 [Terriglobia bacterium]
MTLERARRRAEGLDSKSHDEIGQLRLGRPNEVLSEIRAYLLRRSEEMDTRNYPIRLLKQHATNGVLLIALGPTVDKGSTPEHFHFDSGARLSFGLTLREVGRQSRLVSFRYHYQLPAARSPEYLRFDLNDAPHADPLVEPRCHLHPGLENVRIPLSLHHPLEILDRIFFVIEKGL